MPWIAKSAARSSRRIQATIDLTLFMTLACRLDPIETSND